MQHAPGLRRDGRDQRGMVVPQGVDTAIPDKSIEIDLAVGVGHATAIAMAEGTGKRA
jgi:hypothetical protein